MATGGLYGNASESVGLYGNTTNFGGSYFEWFIFYQSDTQPATPTGGSWSFTTNSGTPPTGWSATPPSAPTLPVWVSIALVNSRSDATLTWSAPGLFSYSSGLPILSGSGAPAPADGINSQLWIQTSTTPQTIWFKQSGTWVRLVGSTLYADLTTNQTIAGIKTFSSPIAGSVTGTAANVTGIVPIINGGTESTTAGGALTNLGAVGTIASADASIVVTRVGSSVDLAVSQTSPASVLLEQVRNITGATLTKGTAVYISGATGQIPTVSKALATSDATSAQTLGLITTDLPNNSNGYVTIIGLISNINTSAYTDGQQLYLSPITAGTLTATKPYAPQHLVYMAVVSYAHPTQGKLLVKVQNGYELDELHNVAAQSPTTGQTIVWNSATSLWEKNTVSLTVGVNGTLPILNGGTGQTTANGAFNALAPSQTGNSGKYLTTDGSNTSWAANPLGTVTSVAASVPSFLSIAGSPITTSGTLAFGLSGTALPTTSGGTGLTSFTSGGVVYASSTSALATGSALTFDGTTLAITGPVSSTRAGTVNYILNDSSSSTSSSLQANSSALYFNANTGAVGAGSFIWRSSSALSELMRLTSTLLYTASTVNIAIGASSGTSGTRLTIQESAANSAALSLLNRNSTQNWKIAVDGVSVDDKLLAFIDNGTSQIRMALTDTGNLGIGTSSPVTSLDVRATNGATIIAGRTANTGTGSEFGYFASYAPNASGTDIIWSQIKSLVSTATAGSEANSIVFSSRTAGSFTEKLRIDSAGNLGIGTSSPAYKLDVSGASVDNPTGGAGSRAVLRIADTTAVAANNGGGILFRGVYTGTTQVDASGIQAYKANATDGNYSYGLAFATRTNGSDIAVNMRLDNAGNLGLGVTPSAWGSNFRALDIAGGSGGGAVYSATNVPYAGLGTNYYESTGSKYKVAGQVATNYLQYAGAHSWYTTGTTTGTAGSAISFTQAMTLDASGNLGVGTTSPASRLHILQANGAASTIEGTATNSRAYNYYKSVDASSAALTAVVGTFGDASRFDVRVETAHPIIFGTTNTERMRIPAAGGVQAKTTISVGDATPSTSGAGITFPATQSASSDANTLDDYEEGTWTPNQGGGLTVVGTFSSAGTYTKIGRLVTVNFYFAGVTSVAVTAGGNMCTNLPFTTQNVTTQNAGVMTNGSNSAGGTCSAERNTTNVWATSTMSATGLIACTITYPV